MVLIVLYVYIHVEDTRCCPQLAFEMLLLGQFQCYVAQLIREIHFLGVLSCLLVVLLV